MARLPRYELEGVPLHVIQRGNNRAPVFAAPNDYRLFRQYLAIACARHECRIHAYVLMTNHFHLLVTPASARALGKVMQSLGRRYVRKFNTTYHRTGTLWEGRYRAIPVDSERYLFACYRYIELNPVRAGLAIHPGQYLWSSHGANARGRTDPLVTLHPEYDALGRDVSTRRAAYRELFACPLDEVMVTRIREATNKGWALGDETFCAEIASRSRRAAPLPRGRRPRAQLESDAIDHQSIVNLPIEV